ncbi:hypothetical protein VMCG_06843 [Cytospora schulzeri]|uniref:GH16 domain-containing protein n=1 Tax=Cytospora schulzeri TaxID=448051 RepID=A0A423W233_9PEZI|nr:hypothetical protein VMCG_06843 [Valsa malicola]
MFSCIWWLVAALVVACEAHRFGTVRDLDGISTSSVSGVYTLSDVYNYTNFFDKFEFFESTIDTNNYEDVDPSHGFVLYQNKSEATRLGLIQTVGDVSVIKPDTNTVITDPTGYGRKSVRLQSITRYNHGLIIADFSHLPQSICGSWPAFWTNGPDWPTTGEIDIYEQWNVEKFNRQTLHTGYNDTVGNCTYNTTSKLGLDNYGMTNYMYSDVCDVYASDNVGCSTYDYEGPFGSATGGMYAMEWTSEYIKTWAWHPQQVPADVIQGQPEPSTWGMPGLVAGSSLCDIDQVFKNQSILLNIDFCGDTAGSEWGSKCAEQTSHPSIITHVRSELSKFSQSKQDPKQARATIQWDQYSSFRWLLTTIASELSLEPSKNRVELKKRIVPGLSAAGIRRKSNDGALNVYQAKFTFKTELLKYLKLLYPSTSESVLKGKLSSDIRFTSAGSDDVDALALPGEEYVRKAWGVSGTLILQAIQEALDPLKKEGVTKTIDDIIVEVVEQVSWLTCVGGSLQISSIEEYTKAAKPGRVSDTRTYHIKPQVTPTAQNCFNISFILAREQKQDKGQLFAKEGHCWKAMVGLALVANGYPTPRRPATTSGRTSGLEVSLSVLLQLCMAKEGPAWRFKARGASDGTSRLVMATGCEKGNLFYWHYVEVQNLKQLPQTKFYLGVNDDDPGLQRVLQPENLVKSSRHFIGWSGGADFLAGTSFISYDIDHSFRVPIGESKLVIPSLSITVRLPQVFSATATLATEKIPSNAQADPMERDHVLNNIRARYFILWDVKYKRGWLVDGATAALHLLRGYLKKHDQTKDFDISSLDHIDEMGPHSAYHVLSSVNNMSKPLWFIPTVSRETEMESAEGGLVKKQKEKITNKAIDLGHMADRVYASLWKMIEIRATMSAYSSLSGAVEKVVEKWGPGSGIKGWDFYELVDADYAQAQNIKIKDAGWLDLAKELRAVFVFGDTFGEVLRPRDGTCCCHFQTLPAGQNYLAVGIATFERLYNKFRGSDATDQTEVRLSRELCWDSPEKPFRETACGPGEHLQKLQPSCFPIQFIKKVPLDKEKKPVKGPTLIRRGEFREMLTNHPNGVVVFGKKQPTGKTLEKMARAMTPEARSSGTQQSSRGTSSPAIAARQLSDQGSGVTVPGSSRGPQAVAASASRTGASRSRTNEPLRVSSRSMAVPKASSSSKDYQAKNN